MITIVVAALIGATVGQLLAETGTDNEIVVGNTGDTLSSIIRANNALIVFGGGNARTELADLLGRSSLPWNRQVDVLIIPGWDSQQVLGALGLLERQRVRQVVILGQPATTELWTVFYQLASSRAVPVTVATSRSRINIGDDVYLDLSAGDPLSNESPEFASLSLTFHDVHVTFIDTSTKAVAAANNTAALPSRTHVQVLTRSSGDVNIAATLLLQPPATSSTTFDLMSSVYRRELGDGERVTLQLKATQLNVDLNAVQRVAGPPRTASPVSD